MRHFEQAEVPLFGQPHWFSGSTLAQGDRSSGLGRGFNVSAWFNTSDMAIGTRCK